MNDGARKAAGAWAASDMPPVQSVRDAPGPHPLTTNHYPRITASRSPLFCSLVPCSLGPLVPAFPPPPHASGAHPPIVFGPHPPCRFVKL